MNEVVEKETSEDIDSLESMSDERLYEFAIARLRDSYSHRGDPFHPTHRLVDQVWEECVRRDRPEIFDEAFQEI